VRGGRPPNSRVESVRALEDVAAEHG
jgi:hypothetical protein